MTHCDQPTDEHLLAALSGRLQERRDALQKTAEILAEVREVNLKLEAAERLKGRFLSNIRNEINNPLTTLRGFAAALAGNPGLPREQIAEMAATMHREASDLSFQMENIFVAADFEAGCTAPESARVHIRSLVSGVMDDLRGLAVHKGMTLAVEAPDDLVVVTDAGKLGLLLANLLRNAIEFGKSNAKVRCEVANEVLTVEVEDDGPGIADDAMERIFDRFVQLSEGSTKSHPGHGLGLSVARACADLLAGTVAAVPQRPAGAMFRVTIPVQHSVGEEDAAAANEFLFDNLETF